MHEINEVIKRNLDAITARMAAAAARANRRPEGIRLVAVTKTEDLETIQALVALDVFDLAENRIESAREKIESLRGSGIRWHMIGPVQRRKAKDVAAYFDTVDAVDRFEVAEALQRRCEECGRCLDVLLEVNVSGEQQKHGFEPAAVPEVLNAVRAFDRLRVNGLMTMAPIDAPEKVLRSVFGGLARLARECHLPEISMGMSDDFEIAIEEGATQVRIGSALFRHCHQNK